MLPRSHSATRPLGIIPAPVPIRAGAAVLGMLLAACSPPPEGPPKPTFLAEATNADELLGLEHLPHFSITLSSAAWASLLAEPKEWVAGDFEYAGRIYEDVGVRLKGNFSFRPLDEKPAIKLDFNRYVPGREFLGLEALTLNNMITDSTMAREWVAYRLFRELGVPTPRVGYARLTVNGEDYGLYLNIEPYDDRFLDRVFADPHGNLYEADNAADVHGPVERWDQDEGDDESRQDLERLSELVTREDDSVFYGPEAVIDMPRFLAFLAGETVTSHFDGHIIGHNFFIYHEPTADRWSYMPWSLDQTFIRHVTPYQSEGYLGYKCLHDPRCLVDYVVASQQALEKVSAVDWDAEMALVIALTQEAAQADPRKPYDSDSIGTGRSAVVTHVEERPDELWPQLDCLVNGQEPDADGDGYGPCFQDCDETNPNINPDAEELCDGIDNDCSGFADDVPACECPSIVSGGRTFYLCPYIMTWLEGYNFCEAQGRQLARFETIEQTTEVSEAAAELSGARWAIGLNDRETEEDYRWLDGSAPSFDAWAEGQPAHKLAWFDCVMLRNGTWSECNCIEKGAFICTDD